MSTDLNFRNAYLVLAHEDVDMLNLLVKRLINTGYVYIHIDLKSRIKVEQVHKHPKVRVTKQIKVNWAITVLAVASLAIHISVGLRTYVYKYFANKADKQAMVTGLSVADNRTKQVNNQTLVSLTANILIIAAMHVLAVSTIYVNNREPEISSSTRTTSWSTCKTSASIHYYFSSLPLFITSKSTTQSFIQTRIQNRSFSYKLCELGQ